VRNLKAFNKALIVIAIIFIAGIGLLIWSMNRKVEGAGLTKLSAEDVQMIIQDEAKGNPRALASLAGDQEQRKKVLENLKQALAVAGEGRRTGFADQPEIKTQLGLAEAEVLATAYDNKLKADAGKANDPGPPFGYIEDKDVDPFFENPANKAKYEAEQQKFLDFLTTMQSKQGAAGGGAPPEMTEEQKTFVISQWKKVTYGAAKAKELGLVDRKTELQYKLQQSLLIARSYSQEKLKDLLTPTDDEVKAYIAANPKFDKAAAKTKAEEVLAKVKAGEDFAALADQYTEDQGNMKDGKPQGGLYDWKARSGYVKEFSDAAWALEAGKTSDLVETQFGYHILKLEGKRSSKDKDGKDQEEVKVRHILISTMYKDPENPMSPPMMTMDDAAKQELAKQKQKEVLDGILARNPIELPDDFHVEAPPPGAENEMQLPPGMQMPPQGPEDGPRPDVPPGKGKDNKPKGAPEAPAPKKK
jgi:hypothetical protein